jgi:adenosylcobinamide kinase/adenosylcobinamide-phosphate guanylyltransferase
VADIVLVIGGARSGKSARAEALIGSYPGTPIYIATAELLDAEMTERVALHRARRGGGWDLREEPLRLLACLRDCDGAGPRLVDCVTLWLSNLMHHGRDWRAEAQGLCAGLKEQTSPVVLVSNEVGQGIVPDNTLARAFRDAAGITNQMLAEAANRVEFVLAGLPLRLK